MDVGSKFAFGNGLERVCGLVDVIVTIDTECVNMVAHCDERGVALADEPFLPELIARGDIVAGSDAPIIDEKPAVRDP